VENAAAQAQRRIAVAGSTRLRHRTCLCLPSADHGAGWQLEASGREKGTV